MKLKIIVVSTLLFSSNVIFTQTKTLNDFSISKIYSEKEAKDNIFEDFGINIKTVSLKEIDPALTNFQDLEWLKQIARKNKVVLIGETHYSQNIANIRDRIVFALNAYDYFPLVIIERQYSLTPFLNHYIQLKSEIDASTFFENALSKMISTKDQFTFIEHLRHWNIQNPTKQIQFGCIDLEWSYDDMCENILKPYFYKLNKIEKSKIDEVIELGVNQSNEFFTKIQPFLAEAKKQNLKGIYSFIDCRYIQNVIDNFSATYNALRYSFDFYRQKALINKIENENYFGEYFKNQKVIMHGGGSHMRSKFCFPNGGNFLSEGSYLNFDYEMTKDRVYSIMLNGLSFLLGEMKDVDLNDCLPQGSQYRSIVERMQNAYKTKVLHSNENYFVFGTRTDFEKFIIAKSYKHPTKGIIIPENEWNKINNYSTELNGDIRAIIENEIEERAAYDVYIYIPYSPITIARKR